MGTAAKLAVPTASRPDLLALQSGEATWWCWTGDGADGTVRRVVTGFMGTQKAIGAVGRNWSDRVADALPAVDFNSPSVTLDWGLEEWSLDCYAVLGPGDDALLEVFRTEGPVVFAGEHTLGAGTIDGAIASGGLAAERLGACLRPM
jgi:hypothetical protein